MCKLATAMVMPHRSPEADTGFRDSGRGGGKEVPVLIRFVLAIAFLVGLSLSAQAEKRMALVIANGVYKNVPALANPPRDGEAIAALLHQIGFETDTRLNLDRAGFESALADFSQSAEDADIAIVYYAGHGIEVDGRNYLIPVDAKLATDKQARFELIGLDDVMASLDGVKGLRAVFLDACRNNPFLASMTRSKATRSIAQGFTPVEAQNGTIISYAAKEGTVAADGLGDHSPYATALLAYMGEPGLEIQFMLRKVRDKVQKLTGGRQEPYISASISGDPIYLAEPPKPVTQSAEPDPVQADFQAAKNVDTAGAWQAFLDKHGQDTSNFYVRLAIEARLKAMQAATAADGGTQGAIREIDPAKPDATVEEEAGSLAVTPPAGSGGKAMRSAPSASDMTKIDKAKPFPPPKNAKDGNRKPPEPQKKQAKPSKPPVTKAKAAKAAPAQLKDRPNAMRYSYGVWPEGSLRTGKAFSQSTQFGKLTCTAMRAFGSDTEIQRICRWQ